VARKAPSLSVGERAALPGIGALPRRKRKGKLMGKLTHQQFFFFLLTDFYLFHEFKQINTCTLTD